MTTIRYFIPEDGDEEIHPNVFLAPKPRQPGTPPLLGQVRDSFPLPGQYHFRFKSPLFPGADREKGAMAVWMDVVNDNAAVPTWKNAIIAKVTRISAEDDDEDDDDEDFAHHHTPVPAPPPPRQQQQHHHAPPQPTRAPPSHQSSVASSDSAHLDIFGDSPSAAGSTGGSAPPPAATPNLFDTPAAVPPAPASGDSLLDMNDYGSQPSHASSSAHPHADFLGMTAPSPAAAPTQPQRQGGGYPGQNMYNATPQQQQQQQRPGQQHGSFQQQQPFSNLGTPWK